MGSGCFKRLVRQLKMKKREEKVDDLFYDHAWEQWDERAEHGPASRHVRRLVLQMLQKLGFHSVLDAGCGEGSLLRAIKNRFPGVELHGVDYSKQAIEASKQEDLGINFILMDLTRQSLPRRFDLITCVDVLEHIENDQAVLSNLHQMSAKYLLLVVPIGTLIQEEKLRLGHIHGYSKDEIRRKLRKAGFQVIREMAWGFPIYLIYRRLILRLPEKASAGYFDWKKKLISKFVYFLLFFDLPIWGNRYHVLCHA